MSPNLTVDYDLDYFNDFENEFPAIVYSDGLTSKSGLGIKPLINSKCIDEFNLIDETSSSEYDEVIVSRFNDLFNDIHPDDLKPEKDDDDNSIDMAPLAAADQRRLFEIRAPLVREVILEFLSTYRMSDTVMDLDTADTLCFQLGGARRRMT
ncbi:hypothetical protein Tco_1526386, partial [Tanacetum coccineum]